MTHQESLPNVPVVLVTGCSSGGLGDALCRAFVAHGCRVFASARKLEKMAELADAGVETLVLDVTRTDDITEAVAQVLTKAGCIDILVNNAGGPCMGPMLDLPIEQIQEHFDLNLFGALRLCQAFIPHMSHRTGGQRRGLVINVGSIVGVAPLLWHGTYSMSKSALRMMTNVLDMECRPLNVNVMLAEPGCFRSNFVNNSIVPKFPDSLYSHFRAAIMRVDAYSQLGNPTPVDAIAEALAERALRKSPPRYFSMGRLSWRTWIMSFLPRWALLFVVWWMFSGLYTDPISNFVQKMM